MSNSDLSQLTKGIRTLKRMTTSLLPTHKKRRGSRKKSTSSKKSKAGKKTRGKKGRKGKKGKRGRHTRRTQKGGSTISYAMPGMALSSSESSMASPAPIAPSDGHAFYDMSNTKGSGSFI